MSIAVLCPSRGNPTALFEAADSCWATLVNTDTKFIPIVDENDPTIGVYFDYNEDVNLPIEMVPKEHTGNMNLALNYVAPRLAEEYDVIGFVGDDHRFRTPAWDVIVGEALEYGGFAYGDDLAQREALPTQVFISSPIITALGWMGLPGAKHLYLDNTWRMLGARAECLHYLPDVVIEHLHPAHGKGQWDENHLRVNTPALYDHDGKVYEQWLATAAEGDIAKVRAALP